jgi:hypothetical protein
MSAPKTVPLLARTVAELIHWLKVLRADECIETCRVVNGEAQHTTRCIRIQAVLDKAEGK